VFFKKTRDIFFIKTAGCPKCGFSIPAKFSAKWTASSNEAPPACPNCCQEFSSQELLAGWVPLFHFKKVYDNLDPFLKTLPDQQDHRAGINKEKAAG
jgi:hypothetical protein